MFQRIQFRNENEIEIQMNAIQKPISIEKLTVYLYGGWFPA